MRASPLLFLFVAGLLGSLYAAMQFVGGPFLGGFSDRTRRRPVRILCLLGASFAYLLLGLAETLRLCAGSVPHAAGGAVPAGFAVSAPCGGF
jgi:DHA1 family tetracycline resistance protein-like MFS transporter